MQLGCIAACSAKDRRQTEAPVMPPVCIADQHTAGWGVAMCITALRLARYPADPGPMGYSDALCAR